MFLKILVAIDGSDTSMKALREAQHLASSHQATLRIVYAAADAEGADQKAGRKLLAQAKASVSSGLTVETRLVRADAVYGLTGVVEAIATAAMEWKADLVVVGSSHRRGLQRWVIGSVAEQLIGKIDASVLLVRPQEAA